MSVEESVSCSCKAAIAAEAIECAQCGRSYFGVLTITREGKDIPTRKEARRRLAEVDPSLKLLLGGRELTIRRADHLVAAEAILREHGFEFAFDSHLEAARFEQAVEEQLRLFDWHELLAYSADEARLANPASCHPVENPAAAAKTREALREAWRRLEPLFTKRARSRAGLLGFLIRKSPVEELLTYALAPQSPGMSLPGAEQQGRRDLSALLPAMLQAIGEHDALVALASAEPEKLAYPAAQISFAPIVERLSPAVWAKLEAFVLAERTPFPDFLAFAHLRGALDAALLDRYLEAKPPSDASELPTDARPLGWLDVFTFDLCPGLPGVLRALIEQLRRDPGSSISRAVAAERSRQERVRRDPPPWDIPGRRAWRIELGAGSASAAVPGPKDELHFLLQLNLAALGGDHPPRVVRLFWDPEETDAAPDEALEVEDQPGAPSFAAGGRRLELRPFEDYPHDSDLSEEVTSDPRWDAQAYSEFRLRQRGGEDLSQVGGYPHFIQRGADELVEQGWEEKCEGCHQPVRLYLQLGDGAPFRIGGDSGRISIAVCTTSECKDPHRSLEFECY